MEVRGCCPDAPIALNSACVLRLSCRAGAEVGDQSVAQVRRRRRERWGCGLAEDGQFF
jgi:hypothetical protein